MCAPGQAAIQARVTTTADVIPLRPGYIYSVGIARDIVLPQQGVFCQRQWELLQHKHLSAFQDAPTGVQGESVEASDNSQEMWLFMYRYMYKHVVVTPTATSREL